MIHSDSIVEHQYLKEPFLVLRVFGKKLLEVGKRKACHKLLKISQKVALCNESCSEVAEKGAFFYFFYFYLV